MSTFSGLSAALSSLVAQRQALEVAGQNVANANTVGYTRQRADLASVHAPAVASMHSSPMQVGTGVNSIGVTRLGDDFLDMRLRAQSSQAASFGASAEALQRLETVVKEPGSTGLSSGLQEFWTAWEDVANSPDSQATRTALLGKASTLTYQLSDTYRTYEAQWDAARTEVDSLASQVNSAAAAVADLNQEIRGITVSGGNANELIDKRSTLITQLSELVGATSRMREDGTLDVLVSGNQLVTGDRAQRIQVEGSYVMAGATSEPAPNANTVRLSWEGSGTPLILRGGELQGTLASVQPTSLGGPISKAVDTVNNLASDLATAVNAIHSTGKTLAAAPNDTGVDFFTFTAALPPALGLKVAITDPFRVAAASATGGAYDNTVADQISQLRESTTSPDMAWRSYVTELGVATQAAVRRAEVSESSRQTAENLQRSNASVDIDEEMTNMMAFQRAYQGAARVVTAVDEMLDTLINRTGVVGR